MLFSGMTFLYFFFPLTLFFYLLLPKSLKNPLLLTASLIFYGWGEPKYIFLMLLSVTLGYFFGLLMERANTKRWKLFFCSLSVTISLSFLLYYKYTDFFLSNFNSLSGLSLPLLKLTLPIGISFYTFQMISYAIDVYRGEKAQRNFIHLATYITMFPQLIAGPIVRYSDIAANLKEREFSLSSAGAGFRRFVFGLGKKILIANQLAELCLQFRVSEEKSVLFYWLYGIAFSLQIYFDFSGYSDMAIGLGKIFGFRFLENFNYPYISGSITEFWRRWHISLGSWFRDYVYIPLGGNRTGAFRQLVNITFVWLLTGFWHGAAWNFVLWGLLYALLLILEKLFLLKVLKKIGPVSSLYVLFTVMIGFILFHASDLREALSDIGGLFGAGGLPLTSAESLYVLKSFAFLLLVAGLGATPLPKRLAERLTEKFTSVKKGLVALEPAFLLLLMLIMTGFLADGSFNPFLYFRF